MTDAKMVDAMIHTAKHSERAGGTRKDRLDAVDYLAAVITRRDAEIERCRAMIRADVEAAAAEDMPGSLAALEAMDAYLAGLDSS